MRLASLPLAGMLKAIRPVSLVSLCFLCWRSVHHAPRQNPQQRQPVKKIKAVISGVIFWLYQVRMEALGVASSGWLPNMSNHHRTRIRFPNTRHQFFLPLKKLRCQFDLWALFLLVATALALNGLRGRCLGWHLGSIGNPLVIAGIAPSGCRIYSGFLALAHGLLPLLAIRGALPYV